MKLTQRLYNDQVEIDFWPESHRYQLKGRKDYLVSVTGATGVLDKSRALLPWATRLNASHILNFLDGKAGQMLSVEEILPIVEESVKQYELARDRAATIGGLVHDWIESYANAKINKTELPPLPDDINLLPGINAFLSWERDHHVVFVAAERLVFSQKYEYVGLLDLLAYVDGVLTLIDNKTSGGIYTDMRYQVTGYRLAYEEEHGPVIGNQMLLRIDKETGVPAVHEMSKEEHEANIPIFLACLAIKKREKEYAKGWS